MLEQGDIRFVLTSGSARQNEVTEFACRHGDGAKSIGLQVPSAEEAYRQAVQRGARGIAEPRWVEDEFGRVELSSIGTYGEVIHTFVNREDYAGPYLPGYRSTLENGQPPGRGRADHARPRRRQRRARPDEPLGRVLRARASG